MRCVCGYENRVGVAYCDRCRKALTQPCQACGEPVPSGSPKCSACGAAAGQPPLAPSSPPQHPPRTAWGEPGEATPPPAPPPPGNWGGNVYGSTQGDTEFVGIVRDFQVRQEQWAERGGEEIWNFRVERYDANGNALQQIPVEMRGLSFSGSVSNGDQVRIRGRWRDRTLRVDELDNLTTHAHVRTKSYRGLRILAGVIIAIIGVGILLAAVSIAISACNDPGGPPPGWPTGP